MLSCSASCILYLHNDTDTDFSYKISADIKPANWTGAKEGTVRRHEFASALFFSPERVSSSGYHQINHVDLEITQNGKTRTHRFQNSELPPNMTPTSRGRLSYIQVTDSGYFVGSGSGNFRINLKETIYFNFPCWFPLFGLTFVVVAIRLISKSVRARKS